MAALGEVTAAEASLEPFHVGYMAVWISACVIALAIYSRDPGAFSITRPGYRRFLSVPWKLATFAIAALGITLVAPYTGDPTWDYFDALFMSVLAFLGAPWAVGSLYLAFAAVCRQGSCSSLSACGCFPPAGPTTCTSSCATDTILRPRKIC